MAGSKISEQHEDDPRLLEKLLAHAGEGARQALAINREIGSQTGQGTNLANLGLAYAKQARRIRRGIISNCR